MTKYSDKRYIVERRNLSKVFATIHVLIIFFNLETEEYYWKKVKMK